MRQHSKWLLHAPRSGRQGCSYRPGVPNSCLPRPIESSSRVVDRPKGSAEEFEKVSQKTREDVLPLTWIRGLALV